MNGNLQIISGVLRLNNERGRVRVDFNTHRAFGDASLVEIRGPRRDFRGTPHIIVTPSDLTLSTHDNTSYRINRSASREALIVNWRIDSAGLQLQIDFLVIGEPA